jgi:hypothetical protein
MDGPPLSAHSIRERLRELLTTGVLPRKPQAKLFAGASSGYRVCIVCGTGIAKGEVEFESSVPTELILFFHRRCADLWMREAEDDDSPA